MTASDTERLLGIAEAVLKNDWSRTRYEELLAEGYIELERDLAQARGALRGARDKETEYELALRWIQEFAAKMLDHPGYVYVERHARSALEHRAALASSPGHHKYAEYERLCQSGVPEPEAYRSVFYPASSSGQQERA